ncbi:MAG TPA: hypothetical protein VMR70_08600 [Flavisolibacter sp.]|nr:hypothetical protein [Flavisolibacter sp.]
MKFYLLVLFSTCCFFAKSQVLPIDSIPKTPTASIVHSIDFNPLEIEGRIQKAILDSFLAAKHILTQPFANLYQSPIQLKNGQANYSGTYDNASFFDKPAYLQFAHLASAWTVGGIPMQIAYKASSWPDAFDGNIRVEYQREGYLNQLKNQLSRKIDPKTLLASIPDPLVALKTNAQRALSNELNQINDQYKNLLGQKITDVGPLHDLFSQNITTVREKFLGQGILQTFSEQQNLFEQLRTKANLGEDIDTTQFNQLKKNILQIEGTKKIIEVIETHKKNWEVSGLLAKMKQWDELKTSQFEQVMRSPSLLSNLVKEQLNLSSLQKLFLKINKLRLGVNSLSSSPLSVQNYLNNGAVAEFMNKGKSAMLFIGKSREGSSILDMPFSNTLFSNSVGKGLQMGKQSKAGSFQFSAMSFAQGFQTIINKGDFEKYKGSLVTSIAKEFVLGSHGQISTEISRSVSQYNNASTGNGETAGLLQLFSLNNLASNTSFRLAYRDELPHLDLTYQMHVKKTALGYDNPGNPFLNSGSREAGLALRKHFMKKTLLFSIRSEIKEFNYSATADQKWRNMYSVIDVKWKLRKGQFFSLRYLPNSMIRISGTQKQKVTFFDQLSADGNFSKKIGSSYYNNYLSLFYQRNHYIVDGANLGSSTLGMITNQTVAIKKLLLYWNTQYNHSANHSQFVYFNSSINSELGTSFGLFKKISATTSLSYNTIQQWYQQIGVRQTISLRLDEGFDLNMFIDARKNLKLYQPLLFGLIRGEVSARYILK